MKTLTVHPAVMKRIQQGNLQPIVTRYELEPDEEIDVETDDEVVSIHTKVHSIQRKSDSLFLVEIEDPATAFTERSNDE